MCIRDSTPADGVVRLQIGANHNVSDGEYVMIPDNALTFSCAHGSGNKTYPRPASATHTPTTASAYNPTTGILTVTTSAAHGMVNGTQVKFPNGLLTFTCAKDSNATTHTYPRIDDPAQDKWLTISNVGATTFQVNVGISPDKSTHTCTAVSGVITERDFPSGRWLKVFGSDKTNGTIKVQVLANNAQGAAGSNASTNTTTHVWQGGNAANAVKRSQVLGGGDYTHTFVNASSGSYTPVITKGGAEVDATIAAFNYARDLAIKSYHQFSDAYGLSLIHI